MNFSCVYCIRRKGDGTDEEGRMDQDEIIPTVRHSLAASPLTRSLIPPGLIDYRFVPFLFLLISSHFLRPVLYQ